MALAAVVLIGIIVLAVINVKASISGRVARGGGGNVTHEPGTGLEAASASNGCKRERKKKQKEEQEIQEAVDAYQNLGIGPGFRLCKYPVKPRIWREIS